MCAHIETVQHALSRRRFTSLYCDGVDHTLGPTYVDGNSHAIKMLPLRYSISTPQGITLWLWDQSLHN